MYFECIDLLNVSVGFLNFYVFLFFIHFPFFLSILFFYRMFFLLGLLPFLMHALENYCFSFLLRFLLRLPFFFLLLLSLYSLLLLHAIRIICISFQVYPFLLLFLSEIILSGLSASLLILRQLIPFTKSTTPGIENCVCS
jgi:hypothetical protein